MIGIFHGLSHFTILVGCFHLAIGSLGWSYLIPQERLNGKGHGRSAEEVSSGESASALRKRGLEQQPGGRTIPSVNGVLIVVVGEIDMEVCNTYILCICTHYT